MFGRKRKKEHQTIRDLDSELRAILDSMPEVSWWPIVLMGFGVVLVWLIGFLPWLAQEQNYPWKLTWGLEKAGEFGDSFGFINSLVSSLALAGVVAAIWLQKQELSEQRKELIITQWELKKSADAQRDSQKELAKQASVNRHQTILASLNGMQQSAESDLYLPDERKAKLRFIEQLRDIVIGNMLEGNDSANLSMKLTERLQKWSELTYLLSTYRGIHNLANLIRQTGEINMYGELAPATKYSHVDQVRLNMLVTTIESNILRLQELNTEGRSSPKLLQDWLDYYRARSDGDDNKFFEMLSTLIDQSKNLAEDAEYLRFALFGADANTGAQARYNLK